MYSLRGNVGWDVRVKGTGGKTMGQLLVEFEHIEGLLRHSFRWSLRAVIISQLKPKRHCQVEF